MATPATNEPRINDRIRAREVRLIGEDGSQLGIKPLPEALHIAREADLDLVEVAPNGVPPVCKVMNYGRWKFEEAQKAKESRRKASNVSIKEMKYRPKIAGGDFDTKTRKVAEFLSQGHKVKVTIMFRFRETHHPEFGRRILDRIAEQVAEIAKVESAPKLDGRNMIMVLAPDKRIAPPEKKPSSARTKTYAESSPEGEAAPTAIAAAVPAAEEAAVTPTQTDTAEAPTAEAQPASQES